ncbi:hypothetical protein V5O48_001276 [Marasmius crinis-equi]|uniref:CFEM domain-containing protein n=1 Tax=Marasmius crinis-equi TaxID=585013 RepID=A0ABR3FYV8_9AGAR
MRAAFFLIAWLASSAAARGFVARQEEHSDQSTSADQSVTTTTSGAASGPSGAAQNSTPLPACSDECYKAQMVSNSCHDSNVDTLKCLCTPNSINALGNCLSCTRNIGTEEALTEARSMEENIAGIINLCGVSSLSVAQPTQATITASASSINPSAATVTIPAVAQASVASAKAKASASASGNKSASNSTSSTGAGASATAKANNSAGKPDLPLFGALAGALALVFNAIP